MDDISSVGEEECDTPSFGGSPDAKRRASGRGSRAGANGAQQHAGNSTFGATRGLAGRATSGAFDPSRASSIHGNSRISQFSSSWESFSRHNSMAERDSRMMRSPRRESVYSDDMEAAGGMRGRFGMRPAAEQLSAELRAGGPGTAMSIEEDDELSKQIVIKVPAGLKDALARRPLNIIPPEERARMGLNNSNISGVLENGGGNPEQVSALEDHDRARSLSGDRLGAGRSSASFYIPEGTTASEHSPQKTPNNEQVGGSSASRGTPRFPLWAMSFEEFKQNLNLGDVLQKTTDCILKYKLPLDGDPDVDKKKRAAGLLPLYPPVSIVADLNEWQQSSASFPAVQILLGTNVTEEDKQTLRRLALSAIEQSAAEKAAEHYKGAIAPLYATEKQRVQTESTALERERETLEAKVKFLEKQRREQAAEEQKLEAERAREERRREEIRSVAAYAAQLREQIAQAEMVVDQKRAAVAHNTSVIQQNNQGQVGNGGGVDLNNSSMELEMWQRELGRVVGGANISSQQNTTAAPQVTDEDIELALKSVAELRTEVDALKIENEKKRLAQRLSLWRSREGKPDRLYLHPVGHELRFTANNSVVDQSHSSAPRWTFTPHAGPEVPLRIAQKLAPEMYQAVWTQARGAPNANSASWQMLLGYKLRQVDRFLHALNGIPRCSLEDTPHFLIFHVMVCPSIDVTSTGFSENYTIPPGTKRSFWIFDLLLSRSELLKYAGHLHDIDWIAKLMVRCRQPHIKSLLEGAIKDVVADESAFARRMAPGALRMFIRDLTKEIHKKILSDLEIANSPEWHAAAASLMTGPHQAIAAASSAQQQQQQGQGFGHGSSSASASDGNFMQLTNFPGQGGQQLASSSHSQQQQYGAAGSAAGAGGNMTRGHPYGRMGGNIMPSPERSVLESVLPTFVK
ncbi:unnamed protein product [Amoebophrya sp. A25]|nr:unnamed protein product [Amoebophrya sp. A25]|eukprot:GSA25T00015360001.1